ncbi:MAG: PfkB family carbohydrate kinase, partial [Gaiellaceae bacterium]
RCELFTALGEDALGERAERRLAELGIDVHAQRFGATRRAWTHVDGAGERTITVLGDKLLPRGALPLDGYDAIFFVAGEPEVLRAARRARFLAATLREQPTLLAAGVPLDLLVGSANDPGERHDASVAARTVVLTAGADGGTVNGVPFPAVPLRSPVVDSYGAGDSFAAALCFALARGDGQAEALTLAARAGAAVLAGKGPYSTQLTL